MVTKDDLKKEYDKFKSKIIPKIERFNNRKTPFGLEELMIRIGYAKYEVGSGDVWKRAPFLGIADIAEKVQKSDFYSLLIEHLKSGGYVPQRSIYLVDVTDYVKLNEAEKYWDMANFPFKIFPLTFYKGTLEIESTQTFILQVNEGIKLELLGFKEIVF